MRQSNTIFAAVAAACFVAATCWPSSAPAEDGHAAATQGALSEAEMAAALHEWAAIWQAEAPLGLVVSAAAEESAMDANLAAKEAEAQVAIAEAVVVAVAPAPQAAPAAEAEIAEEADEQPMADAEDQLVVETAPEAPVQIDVAIAPQAVEADLDPALVGPNREFLQVELSFAHRVCQFSDEQRSAVVAAAIEGVREHAQQHPGNQQQLNGFVVFAGRVGNNNQEGMDEKIAEIVAAAVAQHATPEQQRAYQRELTLRTEFRRQATAASATAIVDRFVLLSSEQKQEIAASLAKKWEPSWDAQIMFAMNNTNYFPGVFPDDCITPHLKPDQKKRWNGVQKINFGGQMQRITEMIGVAMTVIDDVPLEEQQEPDQQQESTQEQQPEQPQEEQP